MIAERFAEGVRIVETTVGIKRWYARCDEHPAWHPGSDYAKSKAIHDAEYHSRDVHDGIDYTGMPAGLVKALRALPDVEKRRVIAREARQWAGKPVRPEPPYYQCHDCTYGTYGKGDFLRHAGAEGHTLDPEELRS